MQEFPIVYGNKQSSHLIRAVAASYGQMRSEKPQPGGRFLEDDDVRLRRRVAFIGSEVQRKLFGGIPPVGETIRIGGQPFEIVGVLEEKVQLSNYNRPDKYCIFIPWTTMSGLSDNRYVGTFVWQAMSPLLEAKAQKQVREFFAKRYRFNPADERALNMFGSEKTHEITDGIVGGLTIVLTFIGVITLAIGGVGIMNIMFVNVQERTREIGVRKALGAKRREILFQFLLEGLATTVAGGIVGITLSWALVWLLSPRPFLAEILDDASRVTDIHLILSVRLVTITTSILMTVGLVSGFLPALKASRLDPIEALRYE
jgi:putative ABC transport system permease protein